MRPAPTLEYAEFRPGDASIYRKAAELLKRGGFCKLDNCGWACCALSAAISKEDTPTYHRLHRRFRDRFVKSPWFGADMTAEHQAARIAALLDMASDAESLAEFVP